jgi:tripartite-type tricarboxylate transporter receptor subunit TctC
MKRRIRILTLLFIVVTVLFHQEARAAAPYYEGKVLTIMVGFSPGGGYDRLSRLLAKHLVRQYDRRQSAV